MRVMSSSIAGSQHGGVLRYAHEELRYGPKVVKIATSQNGAVLSLANVNRKKDLEAIRTLRFTRSR
jgi:hypothetical protein